MSLSRTFIRFLKRMHVLIVRWYMDLINVITLIRARLTGRKIVYVQFARVNNFGDQFNIDLTSFFNTQLIYTHSYKKSQVALCGSILGSYLRDYNGYILGAGFIASRYDRKENNWNVKMIRGPLSAAQCGNEKKGILYADPGILASQIYPDKTKKIYELGILPHSKDVAMMKKVQWPAGVTLIHPRRKPSIVANHIKQCKAIASSSLHGLIFADSFRIPNIHLKMSDKLKGGFHKFNDYYQGMEMQYEYVNWDSSLSKEKIISACKLRCKNEYLIEKQEKVIALMKHVLLKISQ